MINFMPLQLWRSIQMREEIKKPKKMAMPPMEGVTFLWIFLRPGMSTRFLSREYLIITGTTRKAMTKEVVDAASCKAIIRIRPKNSDSVAKSSFLIKLLNVFAHVSDLPGC
jgi:hypothetical protein